MKSAMEKTTIVTEVSMKTWKKSVTPVLLVQKEMGFVKKESKVAKVDNGEAVLGKFFQKRRLATVKMMIATVQSMTLPLCARVAKSASRVYVLCLANKTAIVPQMHDVRDKYAQKSHVVELLLRVGIPVWIRAKTSTIAELVEKHVKATNCVIPLCVVLFAK